MELPLLTEIDFNSKTSRSFTVTVDGLKDMLQNGKQLKRIKLTGIRDLHIDHNAIETLLNAIQIDANISIYFEGCKHKTSFNVPNIIKKYRIQKFKSPDNRLEIIYEEKENYNRCELCEDEKIARE